MLSHWKKSYDQCRQHIQKQRYYFANKCPRVKAMFFPVVMYGSESWNIKKAEYRRTDAFELWCWGRLFRVPWSARRSNQSILEEISPEYSLEGLMLKLKLQNFGTWSEELTHWKRPWCWERLKAERAGDNSGKKWLGGITDSMDMSLSKPRNFQGDVLMDREAWRAAVHGIAKRQDWVTELNWANQWIFSNGNVFLKLC